MMRRQIFPIDIMENSSETLIKSNQVATYVIYLIVTVFVLLAFVMSYFVKVDVNVTSSAIVKSLGERVVVNSPYASFVSSLYIFENKKVNIGDTLLLLNSDRIESERNKYYTRLKEVSEYIKDLQLLIKVNENVANLSQSQLRSASYKKSLSYYMSQRIELETKLKNLTENYIRNKRLLEYGDISKSEFEPIKAEYDNSRLAIDLLYNRQIGEWQSELDRFITELRGLNSDLAQISAKTKESVIVSPITGIIQRIEGVHIGSYVQQGQKLFEISLDGQLYAECLVSPRDIGYIKKGQAVKMQVDAFNYNEWGGVSGSVADIYNDVTLIDTQKGKLPFFKVICSIDNTSLSLKNGYKGEIKRGMTMNCRFKVTQRTVFQLLYDRIDNWINPNTSKNKNL